MAHNNTCKYLAEKFPNAFVRWLLPLEEPTTTKVLSSELIVQSKQTDSFVFLKADNQILHLEFETLPYSHASISFRMLDYYVRLKQQYSCAIHQVVIFLQKTTSSQTFISDYTDNNTLHRYRVIRIWEQNPDLLLSMPGLLPFASLTQTKSPLGLLELIANRIAIIGEPNQQADLLTYTQILAGLQFDVRLIRQVFRRETMRGSVIYQDIFEEGIQTGRQQGRQWEALSLVTRLLNRQLGDIAPRILLRIQALPVEALEELGEALLGFSTATDLENWLKSR